MFLQHWTDPMSLSEGFTRYTPVPNLLCLLSGWSSMKSAFRTSMNDFDHVDSSVLLPTGPPP